MMKRNHANRRVIPLMLISVMLAAAIPGAWAETEEAFRAHEGLSSVVETLKQEAAQLEEENRGLRNMLAQQDDGELYVVVETESNRL